MKLVTKKYGNREAIRERWYRRRFLAPNLVTLGNLFCGFLGIIYASSFRYEKAAIAVGIAILLDGLDGRVARRLNATSKFGVEFDSFSDFLSFGLAPAFLLYHWGLVSIADEFGVFVTFLYAICAATRLARFNVSDDNPKAFTGLPTPGAAGLIAAVVFVFPQTFNSEITSVVASVLAVSLGGLMVSRLRFLSLKKFQLSDMPLPATVLIGGFIALTWYHPRPALLSLALLYVCSGPLGVLYRWLYRKSDSEKAEPGENRGTKSSKA
ncbi:MAG: CDP-diacylglycerol--serine O-phosphatidyltransferase [Bdellovibrionales bacterium]|nr:CDP-diacylglycerol--serine O-phosphatidyltransferase [Bdellovibrionales bacterium]